MTYRTPTEIREMVRQLIREELMVVLESKHGDSWSSPSITVQICLGTDLFSREVVSSDTVTVPT